MSTPKILRNFLPYLSVAAFAVLASTVHADPAPSSDLAAWWKGRYFTGEWFGYRDTLEDKGITFSGSWVGIYFGILDSKDGAQNAFLQELQFSGHLDFAKLTGFDSLRGLEGFVIGRYRQGNDPNNFIDASPNFQATHIASGMQWRMLAFGFTYTTPELFGVKDFLSFTGGWLQPQRQFILQNFSTEFINGSIGSAKGIGNNIPFSTSFSTWGGVLTVHPTDWSYAKGALFMSYENAVDDGNHGLAYQGYAPDPSTNGLMAMYEGGFTPQIGPSRLSGKYVFGGYWYGQPNDSYNHSYYAGVYGFYWQLDQMLYRAPAHADTAAAVTNDGHKTVVATAARPPLSEKGLYVINLFTFSPGYNQPLTFYYHTGLVYRGLIPTRDNDQLMAAVAYGNYSYQNLQHLEQKGDPNQPTYTAVVELDYRFQISGWAYIQPYFQYIVRPNGTPQVANAAVLGFMTGVTF